MWGGTRILLQADIDRAVIRKVLLDALADVCLPPGQSLHALAADASGDRITPRLCTLDGSAEAFERTFDRIDTIREMLRRLPALASGNTMLLPLTVEQTRRALRKTAREMLDRLNAEPERWTDNDRQRMLDARDAALRMVHALLHQTTA